MKQLEFSFTLDRSVLGFVSDCPGCGRRHTEGYYETARRYPRLFWKTMEPHFLVEPITEIVHHCCGERCFAEAKNNIAVQNLLAVMVIAASRGKLMWRTFSMEELEKALSQGKTAKDLMPSY